MEKYILVKPSTRHKEKALEFKKEFELKKEPLHGANGFHIYDSYEDWLSYNELFEKKETVPEGFVCGFTFFLIEENKNDILGVVNIRPELNEYLQKVGGHIGYSINCNFRNQGLGKIQLKLALEYCKENFNLEKVLVTCDDNNVFSAKTIIACGGILEDKIEDEGKLVRRYWINL